MKTKHQLISIKFIFHISNPSTTYLAPEFIKWNIQTGGQYLLKNDFFRKSISIWKADQPPPTLPNYIFVDPQFKKLSLSCWVKISVYRELMLYKSVSLIPPSPELIFIDRL